MKAILKAKHWQIFVILMLLSFLSNISIGDSSILEVFFASLFLIAIISFPIIIGNELYEYVPEKMKLNYNLFLVNGALVLLIVGIALAFGDGQHYEFSGLAALPIYYVMFAYLHIYAFPVKELKSIELGREVKLGEYAGDVVLMLIWPVGIWFIQPRINKVINERETFVKK
ncbi:hypothetical protein [Pontibacter mangrovi]|uniref:Uncharacterized protein n=1 Tax=Pontibacter mangrovi TaxID=2589816 RepID=A0A501W5Q2_9BACT|nr:hypothetical protein [Pontibacter mangrovi]TPE44608.1 hypothetical protein FJM65_06140 [Pontibacter mangrovi]